MAFASAPARAPLVRPSQAPATLLLALLMGPQPVSTDLMLRALPAMAADLQAGMAPVQLTMSAPILAFGLVQSVGCPVAVASPLLAGLLVSARGWRSAMWAMEAVGAGLGLTLVRRQGGPQPVAAPAP